TGWRVDRAETKRNLRCDRRRGGFAFEEDLSEQGRAHLLGHALEADFSHVLDRAWLSRRNDLGRKVSQPPESDRTARLLDRPDEVALAVDGHLGNDTRRIVPLFADHAAYDHVPGKPGISLPVELDMVLGLVNLLGQPFGERTISGPAQVAQ